MNRKKSHITDLFFTLSLFAVFASCSFILILIGVQVYRSSADQLASTYSTRTSLSYVAEKIRQHDSEGNIFLTQLDGETALVMKDTVKKEIWLTYIYAKDNQLYELSVRENRPVSTELGEPILEVKDFQIQNKGDGFLEFSAADINGNPINLLVHPRSDQTIYPQ